MDTNEHNEAEMRPGDLLVGAEAIRAYLAYLGMPEDVDVYYLSAPAAGRSAKPLAKAEDSSPPSVDSSVTLKKSRAASTAA